MPTSRLWHGQASMGDVSGNELVLDRGEGAWLRDVAGRDYLDATASLWYANVGYGRHDIADAVSAQLRRLHAYQTHGDLATAPALELADALAALAPLEDARVFLTSGGGEAIETAVKLVRRFHHLRDEASRTVLISRTRGYHGLSGFGTSLTGIEGHAEGHGPGIGDVVQVPWDDLGALETAIDRLGEHRLAGFVAEPVIGTGGVLAAPDGYLAGASRLVHRAGGLVVADEVVTGFGRVGDWFASPRLGLAADLVVFAKGVTSGYAPLGGVLVSGEVAAPFWRPGVVWRHGYTYSGHAAAAVAAIANLEVIESENLLPRARELERELAVALEPLLQLPCVDMIRSGTGVMAAIELRGPITRSREAVLACRREGVLTRTLTGGGLQVSPPLVLTSHDLDELVVRLRRALTSLDES